MKTLISASIMFLGLAVTALAQPKVAYSVDAAEIFGVSAITAADSGFDMALSNFSLNPLSRIPVIEAVRPYLLIVKNDSNNAIARIVVRFELSYPDRPVTWIRTVSRLDGGTVLEPGGRLLVFQGIRNADNGTVSSSQKEVDQLASELERAEEVVVALDSVIFDSGLIVGPDKTGAEEQYRAQQEAIRYMLDELRRLTHAPDTIETPSEFLGRLAALTTRPSLPVAEGARDYSLNYQYALKTLANRFIARNSSIDSHIEELTWLNIRMKDLYRK